VSQHVISVSATNVYDREHPTDPHLAYLVSCTCGQRWRTRHRDRHAAEASGEAHLRYVGVLTSTQKPAETKQGADSGAKREEVTQNTGGYLS
jgi:hypothetical protein